MGMCMCKCVLPVNVCVYVFLELSKLRKNVLGVWDCSAVSKLLAVQV